MELLIGFLFGGFVGFEIANFMASAKHEEAKQKRYPLVSVINEEMTKEQKEERRIKNQVAWEDHINRLKAEHN